MTPPYFGFVADDLQRIEAESPVACVEFHETIGSTNDRALTLARESSARLPALVLAGEQTAGRGRGRNMWSSAPGSLTFSLVVELHEELPLDRLPVVSLAAASAVCQTIEQAMPGECSIGLKWPNDVFVDNSKVCGILAESVSTPQRRVVIGIGLNVNNDLGDVDPEIRNRATSMARVAGIQFPLVDILVLLLTQLESSIGSFERGDDTWLADCRRRCMLTGQTIEISTEQGSRTALCKGIAADGTLDVESDNCRSNIVSGTVRLVHEPR